MAQSLAYLGDMVSWIALPLVAVTTLDASVAQVGVLAALAPLPMLLFGSHVGAYVDRRQSDFPIMRIAAFARAAVLASVPAAAFRDALTFSHLALVAVVMGTASVFFNVAASTALPGMCARQELVAANSATRMSFSAAAVAGPSLGGLLTQVASAPAALLFDSLAFVVVALILGRVRPSHPTTGEATPHEDDGSLRSALRIIRSNRTQLGLALESVSGVFGFTAYFTILVVFAIENLHLTPGQLGAALGIGAAGALAGSALASPLARAIGLGPTLVVGAIAYPGVLLVVPFAPTDDPSAALAILATAEFLSAVGLMLAEIPAASIQQTITPRAQLGRIRGINLAANYGARTVAALTAGFLAHSLGNQLTMSGFLVLSTLGCILIAATPVRRIITLDQLATRRSARDTVHLPSGPGRV